jgi:hypothetical protein
VLSDGVTPSAGTSGGQIHAFDDPDAQAAVFYRYPERLPMRPFHFHRQLALKAQRCDWKAVNA